jgi:hypothetical protein
VIRTRGVHSKAKTTNAIGTARDMEADEPFSNTGFRKDERAVWSAVHSWCKQIVMAIGK